LTATEIAPNLKFRKTDLLDWIRAEISVSQPASGRNNCPRRDEASDCKLCRVATSIYYDERYKDLIVAIGKSDFQMFRNLSDGQRIMLTLIGDLAKRVIMLIRNWGRDVLQQTPGIVMIDELDCICIQRGSAA